MPKPKKTKKAKPYKSSYLPAYLMIVVAVLVISVLVIGLFYVWYFSAVVGPIKQLAVNQQNLAEEIKDLNPDTTIESTDIKETTVRSLAPKIISDVYFSEKENLLLLISPGAYCESGTLYEYNIKQDSLVEVDLDTKGRGCLSSMRDFGDREGDVLEIKGYGGDAGMVVDSFFEYDISKNEVELTKEHISSESDPEGQWINY